MTTDAASGPTPPITPPPGEAPPRARRWSWQSMLLVASLALNFLVLGAAVGRHAGEWRRGGDDPLAGPTMRFLNGLPDNRRTALNAHITAVGAAMADTRKLAGSARPDALAALTAEPFDRAMFAAALRRLPEAQRDAVEPLAALASALTPAERRDLARRIASGPGRRGRR